MTTLNTMDKLNSIMDILETFEPEKLSIYRQWIEEIAQEYEANKDKISRRNMQIKELKEQLKDVNDICKVLDLFSNTDLTNRNANDVIRELRIRINR